MCTFLCSCCTNGFFFEKTCNFRGMNMNTNTRKETRPLTSVHNLRGLFKHVKISMERTFSIVQLSEANAPCLFVLSAMDQCTQHLQFREFC